MTTLAGTTDVHGSIATLVLRHQAMLRRYVRFLGASVQDAEDVAQDTFVAALTAGKAWTDERAAAAWLRTVARNRLRNRWQREARHAAGDLDELARTWERCCGDDDGERLREALRECLRHVQPRQLEALRLRYGEDLPIAAVGERLGIARAGADALLTRARSVVRRCLEARWS